MKAAEKQNLKAVLLLAQCEVGMCDKEGNTALMKYLKSCESDNNKNSNLKIIKLLLQETGK